MNRRDVMDVTEAKRRRRAVQRRIAVVTYGNYVDREELDKLLAESERLHAIVRSDRGRRTHVQDKFGTARLTSDDGEMVYFENLDAALLFIGLSNSKYYDLKRKGVKQFNGYTVDVRNRRYKLERDGEEVATGTIGEISRETGIPQSTLRTYGSALGGWRLSDVETWD